MMVLFQTMSRYWVVAGVWFTLHQSVLKATRLTSNSMASQFQDVHLYVKLRTQVSLAVSYLVHCANLDLIYLQARFP